MADDVDHERTLGPVPTAPRADATRLAEGDVLQGRYRLGPEIGRGAFGAVRRAHDLLIDQPVALKLLHRADAEAVWLLKREFRVLRGLRHPQLLRLYELYTDRAPYFFSMELVHGRPLSSLEHGRWERLRPLLAQVASGLEWLHRRGFAHGDVKPTNVLVDHAERVVLCDFGLRGCIQNMLH